MKEDLIKSKRHSKIVGDFGESIIMYWLSKRNFEPVLVDYIGIDIIAYNKGNANRLGISVKSRTRTPGSEKDSLTVNSKQIPLIRQACEYFSCKPYFGCVIDKEQEMSIEIYLITLKDILMINNYNEGDKRLSIKFTDEYLKEYQKVANSYIIRLRYDEMRRNMI